MTGRGPNGACRATPRSRPARRQGLSRCSHDTITYLEMLARPTSGRAPTPIGKLALMRAENCTVSFYRYIYDAVGEPWLWFERRLFGDAALVAADHQADDRDFRALCRRGAGRLFRARHRRDARDQAVLFRADPRFYRPRARRLTCCRRRSTAPGPRGRSTVSGCTPRPSITRMRCGSISAPGLSFMPAGRYRSRIRACTASCRALCATACCRRWTGSNGTPSRICGAEQDSQRSISCRDPSPAPVAHRCAAPEARPSAGTPKRGKCAPSLHGSFAMTYRHGQRRDHWRGGARRRANLR